MIGDLVPLDDLEPRQDSLSTSGQLSGKRPPLAAVACAPLSCFYCLALFFLRSCFCPVPFPLSPEAFPTLVCLPSIRRISETPTPTGLGESTAVHLQFVRQYPPHLYHCTFLASKPWGKGNPTVHLPFVLQYTSHLYCSTLPVCTAVPLRKYWGLGSPASSRL